MSTSEGQKPNDPWSFWYWLLWDDTKDDSHPGYRRYFDGFMKWQILFSLSLASILHWREISLDSLSHGVLPIVAILFGTSFAWGGNAIGLLQSEELLDLMNANKNGVPDYVYTNQTAILLSLLATLVWGGVYAISLPPEVTGNIYFEVAYIGISTAAILLTVLTIRDCWHVISQVHWQMIVKAKIRQHRKEQIDAAAQESQE